MKRKLFVVASSLWRSKISRIEVSLQRRLGNLGVDRIVPPNHDAFEFNIRENLDRTGFIFKIPADLKCPGHREPSPFAAQQPNAMLVREGVLTIIKVARIVRQNRMKLGFVKRHFGFAGR
jgi:hypothetical protein